MPFYAKKLKSVCPFNFNVNRNANNNISVQIYLDNDTVQVFRESSEQNVDVKRIGKADPQISLDNYTNERYEKNLFAEKDEPRYFIGL